MERMNTSISLSYLPTFQECLHCLKVTRSQRQREISDVVYEENLSGAQSRGKKATKHIGGLVELPHMCVHQYLTKYLRSPLCGSPGFTLYLALSFQVMSYELQLLFTPDSHLCLFNSGNLLISTQIPYSTLCFCYSQDFLFFYFLFFCLFGWLVGYSQNFFLFGYSQYVGYWKYPKIY